MRGQGKNSEEFLTGSPMAGSVHPARACARASAGENWPLGQAGSTSLRWKVASERVCSDAGETVREAGTPLPGVS